MPIYEYRCDNCTDEFEIIQKFSDRPLSKCKKCGGHLQKLLSRSAFTLKGGGWYADGYKGGAKGSSKTTTTTSTGATEVTSKKSD